MAVVRVAVVVVARVAVLKMVTAEACSTSRRYPERSGRCAREIAEIRKRRKGEGGDEEDVQGRWH